VTFTATVAATPPTTGTPSGTVTFTDTAGALGAPCAAVRLVAGQATCSVSLSMTDNVTATYRGDANFLGSSAGPLAQTVTRAASAVHLASSLNPSAFGQTVTFSATVVATAPGSGTPTGPVSFFDGSSLMGTASLSNGVATLSTSSLPVNNHRVTASYGGDSNFTPSTSSVVSQVVNNAATRLVAASAARVNPTFQATLTRTFDGVALGGRIVVFSVSGSTKCTATTNSLGVASCRASGFFFASSYTASFAGATNYLPATTTGQLR